VRGLQRGPMGGHGTSEEAGRLADSLEREGALRLILEEPDHKRGRPSSPSYEINPELLRHADTNDKKGAQNNGYAMPYECARAVFDDDERCAKCGHLR